MVTRRPPRPAATVIRRVARPLGAHMEAAILAGCWLSASLLAAVAGRPLLAAIGLATVAPALIAYALVARSGCAQEDSNL